MSSVVLMLRGKYAVRHPTDTAPTFSVANPGTLVDGLVNRVTLLPYRVEQDPTRRHQELPPLVAGGPRRRALVVDLRVILTAWMSDPEGELLVLSRCMEILDGTPVLSGALLDPAYPWDPDTNLRVAMDQQSAEESLRLWDALKPTYRLSVPYLIRTIRLTPTEIGEHPHVGASTRIYVPGVPEGA